MAWWVGARSDAAGTVRRWLVAAAADLQWEGGWGGLWLGRVVRSVTEVDDACG